MYLTSAASWRIRLPESWQLGQPPSARVAAMVSYRRRFTPPPWAWTAIGGFVAPALVLLALEHAVWLAVVPASFAAYMLLRSAATRIVVFVIGGFLVFQTSTGLSTPKLLYIAATVISVLAVISRLRRTLANDWAMGLRMTLWGCALLAGWIVFITLPWSSSLGAASLSGWFRDATTYLLMPAGVLIGIDAGSRVSVRTARLLTATVGAVSALGFASHWIAVRGLSEADASTNVQNLLSSLAALAVPLALALTLGLTEDRMHIGWLLFGAAMLMAAVITGTRTSIVLAVALLGVWGSRAKRRAPLSRILSGVAIMSAILAAALPLALAAFSSTEAVMQRMKSVTLILSSGLSSDQSGLARLRAGEISQAIWRSQPWLGRGLGVTFPSLNPGRTSGTFSLDTPWMFLAKFGLVGSVVLAIAFLLIFSSTQKRSTAWVPAGTVARAAIAAWIALLPLASIPEDKGFALTTALIFAMLIAERRDPNGTGNRRPSTGAVWLRPRGRRQ